MTYEDDLEFLSDYARQNFPAAVYSKGINNSEFRQKNIQHWASQFVLMKCYDARRDDPAEILMDQGSVYQVESTFAKQDLNIINYHDAYKAIDIMRDALLRKRGFVFKYE